MSPRVTRVHVITPIITSGFRDESGLKAVCPEGCEVSRAFLERGPASVESAVDEVLAAPGVVDAAIRAETEGADAIVIDCMLDPGLDAAREATPCPVVGCGEAAFRRAAEHGRFCVVTVLDRQARAFRSLAMALGLGENLVSVRGIGVPVLELETDRPGSIEATIREARRAVEEDGASAIVFGCTGMLGFGAEVEAALDGRATVIDPLPLAISVACDAERSDGRTQGYPAPERKRVAGFEGWPSLYSAINSEAGG